MRPSNALWKTQAFQTDAKFKLNQAMSEAASYSLGAISQLTAGGNQDGIVTVQAQTLLQQFIRQLQQFERNESNGSI